MKNLTPHAEPVTWAAVVAAIVAALASYGLNITNELAHLLVMIAPFVGAALWARLRVWAPASHAAAVDAAYRAGLAEASLGKGDGQGRT